MITVSLNEIKSQNPCEKALEEIWQQVYKHIEALKGEV